MVDFFVVGAQKAGTSWMYACLYEHPEICAPTKEIHYFSRERNFRKGIDWYKNIFNVCKDGQLNGEFSTTYLYDENTPWRIKKEFPCAKIIISLRNPVTRAFSHYGNLVKGGEVPKTASFDDVSEGDSSVLGQGMYYDQVRRYIDIFGEENVLVLIYEDSKDNPTKFIQSIFEFLGIDTEFKPTMLCRKVNVARTPRKIWIEKIMMYVAEFLRRSRLGKIAWIIKKSGAPDFIRNLNTEGLGMELDSEIRKKIGNYFNEDVKKLSKLIDKNLIDKWQLGEIVE